MLKTLRTPKTEKIYEEFKKENPDHCPFCSKDLLIQDSFVVEKGFIDGWILLKNRFPYDRMYVKNDMLAPAEHVKKLNEKKEKEFKLLLDHLQDHYHQVLWNVPYRQSIPHFHIHLVRFE